MATFVLAYGAWSSARAWKKVRPLAPPGDPFRQFAERAQREGWRYFELDASHSPNVTAPEALAELLAEIARTSAS
jgi:hypothetical protein